MYNAPIEDMRFVLEHLAGMEGVLALPGNEDCSPDLVDAILTEAAKMTGNIIAPLNHAADQQGCIRHEDGSVETPPGFKQAWSALADGGWTAMDADAEHGGQNLPMLVSAMVNEMLQSASMSFALCHLLTQGQIYALQKSASPEQQACFIPPMVEGRWTGTMNLTEPQAGTDLAAIRTVATPQDDHYRIRGQKIYITYGEHDLSENIIHLVLARTPDAPPGIKGISLFIVPKYLVNADGSPMLDGVPIRNDVQCLSIEKKLGIKGSPTAVLQYGEKDGAIGWLVGAENQGLAIMFQMMNHARFAVGLQGLAIAERALQQAVAYANERRQGTPLEGQPGDTIIHHPDVLRQVTTMKAETEAMRAVLAVGAAALDHAEHESTAADGNNAAELRAGLLIPIIKGWITERSVEIASIALQVHGGMGFIEETGAAQHYRDARILPIYEGTTAIQANDLVFRKTLRDGGAAVRLLLADIAADREMLVNHDSEQARACGIALGRALEAAEQALDHQLAVANKPRRPAVNGTAWLMLLGTLLGGWQMGRSAAIAAEKLADDAGRADFWHAKLVTATVYSSHHLPRVDSLYRSIIEGDEAVLAMNPNWLN